MYSLRFQGFNGVRLTTSASEVISSSMRSPESPLKGMRNREGFLGPHKPLTPRIETGPDKGKLADIEDIIRQARQGTMTEQAALDLVRQRLNE